MRRVRAALQVVSSAACFVLASAAGCGGSGAKGTGGAAATGAHTGGATSATGGGAATGTGGGATGTGGGSANANARTSAACGDVPILGDQELHNTAACAACVDAKCCQPGLACEMDAECTALRACFTGCPAPGALGDACTQACFQQHPNGASLSQDFSICREKSCGYECTDFTCVGHVTWPAATGDLTFPVTLQDMGSGAYFAAADVKVCATADVDCASPLSTGTTDAMGTITVTAPAAPGGPDAYLLVHGPDAPDAAIYFQWPTGAAAFTPQSKWTAYYPGNTTIQSDLGIALDPARGSVAFEAYSCGGELASGISVAASTADASTTTAYESGVAGFSTSATATTANGPGGVIANLPPGPLTITSTLAKDGTTYGKEDLRIWAGRFSVIVAAPTP